MSEVVEWLLLLLLLLLLVLWGVALTPATSRAEVKERAEPYLYSPSGHSWPVLR